MSLVCSVDVEWLYSKASKTFFPAVGGIYLLKSTALDA